MNILAGLLLAVLLATPAKATTVEDINAMSTCDVVNFLGLNVMKQYQAGVTLKNALTLVENKFAKGSFFYIVVKGMVMEAYTTTRYSTDKYQLSAGTKFADQYYIWCIKNV